MTKLLIHEIESIRAQSSPPWADDACGVTRRDTQISALVHRDAYMDESARHRILLVAGIKGTTDDAQMAVAAARWYSSSQRIRNRIALSIIPCANPDGLELEVAPSNGSGGNPSIGYPPEDGFFDHPTDPESRYLWRYIGFMAPDLLIELRAGDSTVWEYGGAPSSVSSFLNATPMPTVTDNSGSLPSALASGFPNELGTIPSLRLTAPPSATGAELDRLTRALDAQGKAIPSPARAELDHRRSRTPMEVAQKLAARYGHTLAPVIYTQGVALSGRLRLGALLGDTGSIAESVSEIVQSYISGERAWFGDSDAGANHAGIVWCDEMFDITGDERYRDLLISIAELYRSNALGDPPAPCDPDYRTEDMFFAGALLGRAYRLTQDASFLDIQTSFLLAADIQQPDGLFWHCRSVPHYWGRGNGFAALGFAETLSYLPQDHPHREELIHMHTWHIDALSHLRRPSGMLSQLLDFDGSYQELTATCMMGYAVARGLRLGWLADSPYRELANELWQTTSERIGADGEVVDGCTGTGAVNNRRFYLDRRAEFGQDDRTGNLALWFAVEMERLQRGI